jgi:PAS domain S-box-containing protein
MPGVVVFGCCAGHCRSDDFVMRSFFARLGRLKPGIWPGIFCALFIWFCVKFGWANSVERLALDTVFMARGTRYADPNIVIIAVDDATVVRAGERTGVGWPLPRRYYAQAIKQLSELGVKTIALDVLLSEPGPRPDEDEKLAEACREAGNVVQAVAFRVGEGQTEPPLDIQGGGLSPRFSLGTKPFPYVRNAIQASMLQPRLSDSAAGLGHLNVFPEQSGTLRRVSHLLRMRNQLYPSLSLATASHFLGQKPVLEPERSQIVLADRTLPIDGDGMTRVNWIGAGTSYPTYSFNDLSAGTVPLQAIKGKVAIISITAQGAFENRATPFSGAVPAVVFQANALDDILSNRVLQAVAPWFTWLLRLGFPILCAVITARRATAGYWPVPLLMLLLVGASAFALSHNIVMPVGLALFGGFLAFTITSARGYRREWENSARADTAVSSLARGTTLLGRLSATGRDQERLLHTIRLTALDTLGAREVYIVLDGENRLDDQRVEQAAQFAQRAGVGWVWPPNSDGHTTRRRRSRARLDEESEALYALMQDETVVAAPLPRLRHDTEEMLEAATSKSRPGRELGGALVAIGRRDGNAFTPRDAVLLETLAEGAALALENWRYAETLRGRIESANRELSGAYQLLAEQSAKLFAAVESIDAALVVCDAEGNAAFVNPAGARVLRGATPILGEPVVSALASGDLEELAQLFADLNAQGTKAEITRLETMRGTDILVAQFTPLVSDEGHFIGTMLVVSDVTAQRELDRMKTDFVGYVAHELRTPLTTILGYASLLDVSAGSFSPEEVRTMTGVISRHCRRMNGMISDLLDISRLESGAPLMVTRRTFDLAALCERLIEEQKPYLNPTPVFHFVFDCPQRPVLWNGDHDRMEQVVLNLLSNALKYSPDGGTITVSLHQSSEEVVLEVRDEGMGLSAHQCGQLFQKFYRTADARARGIKGTGLGLNLVRQIVQAQDGRIEVFSKRDAGEKGASFRITLPHVESS